ncbi:thiamine phosphate synthase [Candidatus Sumerlaeota bacterium]|nr:thiamine phosphate synthase [Candidatus Sumerlaeota bacterium]
MEIKNKKEICRNWNLYVITDLAMAAPRNYIQIIREVLMGGANVVQIRDKTTPFEELIEVGLKIKPMFEEYGASLIVNDNPYLAKEIDADGAHLGQEDMPVDIAREILGANKIIGLSTHTKAQAIHAMFLDVDYIGIGPIFPTSTKKSEYAPLGIPMLQWMSREIKLPFVPIGGINGDNIKEVCLNGGTAPAVASAIMKSDNLTETTRELIRTIKETKGRNP